MPVFNLKFTKMALWLDNAAYKG